MLLLHGLNGCGLLWMPESEFSCCVVPESQCGSMVSQGLSFFHVRQAFFNAQAVLRVVW